MPVDDYRNIGNPITVRGIEGNSDRPQFRRIYTSPENYEYIEFRHDDVLQDYEVVHTEGESGNSPLRELKLDPNAIVYQVFANSSEYAIDGHVVAMERLAPPAPELSDSAPKPASDPPDISLVAAPDILLRIAPTLASVGANWQGECEGGDRFDNNCAHFLSDAFIRAGYTELKSYGARCYTPAKRPIRAREMRNWFKSKATKVSSVPQQGTGWWAAFQLNEAVYWGGHVALLDSDSWNYYGTGWYETWSQELYQW